jgi:hypothetical protein
MRFPERAEFLLMKLIASINDVDEIIKDAVCSMRILRKLNQCHFLTL